MNPGVATGAVGLVAGPIIGAQRGGIKGCAQGIVTGRYWTGLPLGVWLGLRALGTKADSGWGMLPAAGGTYCLHSLALATLGPHTGALHLGSWCVLV